MGVSSLAVMANSLTLHLYQGLDNRASQNSSSHAFQDTSWKAIKPGSQFASPFRIQQRAGKTVL